MTSKQIVVWMTVAILSWYGMMAIHEAGHCLGAVATGAQIDAVEIPIVGFSRTDFSGGRSPLLVAWAGPVLGAALPTVFLIFLRASRHRVRHVLLFFVGFCLLANEVYIGGGAFSGAGDCRQLARYGSPAWLLAAPFCFSVRLLAEGHSSPLAGVSLVAAVSMPVASLAAVTKPDGFVLPAVAILAVLGYFGWGFVLISAGV